MNPQELVSRVKVWAGGGEEDPVGTEAGHGAFDEVLMAGNRCRPWAPLRDLHRGIVDNNNNRVYVSGYVWHYGDPVVPARR